jgi:hypothetical protein
MRWTRQALAAVVAALACSAAARGQDESAPVATPPPTLHSGSTNFDLGEMLTPLPEKFILFKDYWSPDGRDVVAGPPTFFRGGLVIVPTPPRLVGLESLGLTFRLGPESAVGSRQIVFGPTDRSWDDLNGWEKFSVSLQYAGAAAALAHFAGKLIH